VDQRVPHLLDRLRERGADFCWHKVRQSGCCDSADAILSPTSEAVSRPSTPHMLKLSPPRPPQHGTFKQHLLGVWKILSIWNQPQALARCGLFHSAYSNSYVNLAIFKAGHDRTLVQQDCGEEAEDLIYKFCGGWT
jgi:hypothetical protein